MARNSSEANETSGEGELAVGHVLDALSSICILNQISPHCVPLEAKIKRQNLSTSKTCVDNYTAKFCDEKLWWGNRSRPSGLRHSQLTYGIIGMP